jgi:hypothetical protein
MGDKNWRTPLSHRGDRQVEGRQGQYPAVGARSMASCPQERPSFECEFCEIKDLTETKVLSFGALAFRKRPTIVLVMKGVAQCRIDGGNTHYIC